MQVSEGLFERFRTRVVNVGNVPMGGDFPIRVQSMTSTDTMDTASTVTQAIRMIEAGSEYVRIAVPGIREVENLRVIKAELHKRGLDTPLIADVHFNPKIAEVAASIVEKVRINPGNYYPASPAPGSRSRQAGFLQDDYLDQVAARLEPLLRICREHGTAIRIGTNHGSLSERIMEKYG